MIAGHLRELAGASGASASSLLAGMLVRKLLILVLVALSNKIARMGLDAADDERGLQSSRGDRGIIQGRSHRLRRRRRSKQGMALRLARRGCKSQ